MKKEQIWLTVKKQYRKKWKYVLVLIPILFWFVYLRIYPNLQVFPLSLYDWSPLRTAKEYVGFENFYILFTVKKAEFMPRVMNTILYVVFLLVIQTTLGLILTLSLRKNTRRNSFFRAYFFLPMVFSSTMVALTWSFMYDPNLGVLNTILGKLGVEGYPGHNFLHGLKYSDVDYINRTLRIKRQLGKKANSKAEDVAPKMLTKQEIKVKTESGVRELPIPDLVFEAILEQRKIYERNRRRRKREFRDWDYICCSSYGNPRSKSYHFKYYKKLLADNNLPDITFHQLRNTYSTILMKNDFNVKGISQLMGHAKEIVTADVYGDTQEIIEDCLYAIEPFIEEVMPIYNKEEYYDYTDVCEMDNLTDEYWIAA